MSEAMIEELRATLDARSVVTEPGDVEGWTTDWRGRWTGKAAALLQPATTAEVQAIVRAAETHGVPLVPQGGNTSMVGGATPDDSGAAVILSLRRLKAVRSIEPATRQAVVEAGLTARAPGRPGPIDDDQRWDATAALGLLTRVTPDR